jgi:hypothetical protein
MGREQFVLTLIFFFVALPVTLGILSDLARRWMKMKEKQIDQGSGAGSAALIAAQAAQITRLEQRVRVLERIATDKGTALVAEIEGLAEAERLTRGS